MSRRAPVQLLDWPTVPRVRRIHSESGYLAFSHAASASREAGAGLARHPRGLDELELGCTRKPLDPRLFPQRRGSISNGDHSRELNRSAAARVAAGGARTVCGHSALNIGRPPAVQGAVSAAEQVDGSHAHGFRQVGDDYLPAQHFAMSALLREDEVRGRVHTQGDGPSDVSTPPGDQVC
jgi:hypothetical protein